MPRKLLREMLRSVEESMVKKFYFRFEHYGWATIVIDEAHGDLLINSDWGKWCHTWGGGPKSWGNRTFIEFLKSADPWYIANKLGYDTKTSERDVDATRARMKSHVIRKRREDYGAIPTMKGLMTKALARDLWGDIEEFCNALEEDESYAYHNMVTVLMDGYFNPVFEWFESRETNQHTFLTEELLPVFLAYLKGEFNEAVELDETTR